MNLLCSAMPLIRVWFYDPRDDPDGWINHLVRRCDGPYCHCELEIVSENSYCIYMGTNVMRKQRAYSKPPYTCVDIFCTVSQLQRCRDFAELQVHNQIAFSTTAFVMSIVPVLAYWGSGTFCSLSLIHI